MFIYPWGQDTSLLPLQLSIAFVPYSSLQWTQEARGRRERGSVCVSGQEGKEKLNGAFGEMSRDQGPPRERVIF